MNTLYQNIILLAAIVSLPACKEINNTATPSGGDSTLLDRFYVDEAPDGAIQISEVFVDPTPGREVVLSGEIMGRMEPFVDGRAMLTLGDPTKITPCNRIPGDSCETPWDCCCDDPAVLKKSVATIQFLDGDGNLIKSGLKGYKGIKELSFLTVNGTIAEGSNPENLLINVSAFHLTDPSPYVNAKPVGMEKGTVKEEDGAFIFTKEPE